MSLAKPVDSLRSQKNGVILREPKRPKDPGAVTSGDRTSPAILCNSTGSFTPRRPTTLPCRRCVQDDPEFENHGRNREPVSRDSIDPGMGGRKIGAGRLGMNDFSAFRPLTHWVSPHRSPASLPLPLFHCPATNISAFHARFQV